MFTRPANLKANSSWYEADLYQLYHIHIALLTAFLIRFPLKSINFEIMTIFYVQQQSTFDIFQRVSFF